MVVQNKNNKEKEQVDPDFKYIVRIASVDLDGEKPAFLALAGMKGIGDRLSECILNDAGYPKEKKLGDITDEEIKKLEDAVLAFQTKAPHWILNRQKDYGSGEDLHLVGMELKMTLEEDLNRMKKIRCYRGIRHESGKKVRGQKTRSNGRKGLTLGVSKKK